MNDAGGKDESVSRQVIPGRAVVWDGLECIARLKTRMPSGPKDCQSSPFLPNFFS